MAAETIIQEILASRRDLTREEIVGMIDEKVKNARGYFTPETAARIVASELGVQAPQTELQSRILIKDVVSGLGDVTITGRVVHVSPFQTFVRSDGTEGGVKRLLVADRSGAIRVVLWNDVAKLAGDRHVKPDQIVRFSHGYVREGLDGKIELNLGTLGEIEIVSRNGLKEEYPPVEDFMIKIGEITEKHGRVDVSGVVQRIFPQSAFKRRNGSEGSTRSLLLSDSTGQIRVVFWDSKVAETENLREGSCLRIMNARVKSRIDNVLELHVGEASNVEVVTVEPSVNLPQNAGRMVKVADLREGGLVTVQGIVATLPLVREVTTARNERVKVVSFELSDNTGKIGVSLWRNLAEIGEKLSVGDNLKITNIHVKRDLSGLKLSSGMLTSVERLPCKVEGSSENEPNTK